MKRKIGRTMILLSTVFLLTSCGKNAETEAPGEMQTEDSDSAYSESDSSGEDLEEESSAPPEYPEGYFTEYKADGFSAMSQVDDMEFSDFQGYNYEYFGEQTPQTYQLVNNPLKLSVTLPELADRIIQQSDVLKEKVKVRTDRESYSYNFLETADQTPLVKLSVELESDAGTDDLDTFGVLQILATKDYTVSDDPLSLRIYLNDGLESVMDGKDVLTKALDGAMDPNYISCMLSTDGEIEQPAEDDYKPYIKNVYETNVPAAKPGSEDTAMLNFTREAGYLTKDHVEEEMQPYVSISASYNGAGQGYSVLRESIPSYEQVMKETGNPINIEKYFSNLNLTGNAKQLCDWAAELNGVDSNMKLMSLNYSMLNGKSEDADDTNRYHVRFGVYNQVPGFDGGVKPGEVTTEINYVTDPYVDHHITGFRFDSNVLINAGSSEITDKTSKDAVEMYTKAFNSICPEAGFTVDGWNLLDDEGTYFAEKEFTVQGETVNCSCSVSVKPYDLEDVHAVQAILQIVYD